MCLFLTKINGMLKITDILNNKEFSKETIALLISENNSKVRDEIKKKSLKIDFAATRDFHNSEKTIIISNYCSANCIYGYYRRTPIRKSF